MLLDDTVRGAKAFKVCAAGDRGQRIFCAVNRDNLTKLLQATAVTSLGLQARHFMLLHVLVHLEL